MVSPRKIPASAGHWLQLPDPALKSGKPIAIIEMAAASGLNLLPPEQYDPWQTTTYGTGQLARVATELGAAAILLGAGGSATNDLGLGALAALGMEFRGFNDEKIRPPVPAHWERIARLDGGVFPSIPPIFIACDVTNPLLGSRGAAAVYGQQKGLRSEDLPRMEAAMERMARLLCVYCGQPAMLMETPGVGAAGGLPFGLLVGAHARLIPGFDLVAAWLNLQARIAAADIVVTGEGCFDESSLSGKGPGAVAAHAGALGKTVHVFAGRCTAAASGKGWHLHAITPAGHPLEWANREAPELLACTLRTVF
jgi:glycerate kinase